MGSGVVLPHDALIAGMACGGVFGAAIACWLANLHLRHVLLVMLAAAPGWLLAASLLLQPIFSLAADNPVNAVTFAQMSLTVQVSEPTAFLRILLILAFGVAVPCLCARYLLRRFGSLQLSTPVSAMWCWSGLSTAYLCARVAWPSSWKQVPGNENQFQLDGVEYSLQTPWGYLRTVDFFGWTHLSAFALALLAGTAVCFLLIGLQPGATFARAVRGALAFPAALAAGLAAGWLFLLLTCGWPYLFRPAVPVFW